MSRSIFSSLALTFLLAGVLVLASCTNEQQQAASTPEPARMEASIRTDPGVAGGVAEEVFVVSATVTALDLPTRRVTLTGSEGTPYTFTAGPEVRNLDQVKVGDKVTTTFARRLSITVRPEGAPQPAAYTAAAGRASLGEKPRGLIAEEYEVSATVKSINAANRTAVLGFADGAERMVPIRSDVDLSRYKAGDTVVARVTTALTVLVTAP